MPVHVCVWIFDVPADLKRIRIPCQNGDAEIGRAGAVWAPFQHLKLHGWVVQTHPCANVKVVRVQRLRGEAQVGRPVLCQVCYADSALATGDARAHAEL